MLDTLSSKSGLPKVMIMSVMSFNGSQEGNVAKEGLL